MDVRRPHVADVGTGYQCANRPIHRNRVADRRDGMDRIGTVGLRPVDAAHPWLLRAALSLIESLAVVLPEVKLGICDRFAIKATHRSGNETGDASPCSLRS